MAQSLVQAKRVAKLSAQRMAPVAKRLCEVGQIVKKGEVIFELDSQDLQIQKEELELKSRDLKAQIEFYRKRLDRRRRNPKAYTEEAIESEALQLTRLELQRDQLVSSQKMVLLHLERSLIKAPFDGVVSSYHAEQGDVVNPSQLIAVLLDWQQLRLLVQVPYEVAKSQEPGLTLKVFDENSKATLQRIHPRVDESNGSVILEYSLPYKEKYQLFHGQTLTVSVPWLKSEVSIPADYVQESHGTYKVRIHQSQGFRLQTIEGEYRNGLFFPWSPQKYIGLKLLSFSR